MWFTRTYPYNALFSLTCEGLESQICLYKLASSMGMTKSLMSTHIKAKDECNRKEW